MLLPMEPQAVGKAFALYHLKVFISISNVFNAEHKEWEVEAALGK